jgi:DNA-directed RNA polymerase specialized sigma24 family protein
MGPPSGDSREPGAVGPSEGEQADRPMSRDEFKGALAEVYPRLIRYAQTLAFNLPDVAGEDIAQATVLRALSGEKMPSHKFLFPWLKKLMQYAIIDRVRFENSRKRRAPIEEMDVDELPSVEQNHVIADVVLWDHLLRILDEEQLSFLTLVLEGLSVGEIADRMQISRRTAFRKVGEIRRSALKLWDDSPTAEFPPAPPTKEQLRAAVRARRRKIR